jgi:hypothetical protein
MDYVYMLLPNGAEWEDVSVYTTFPEALEGLKRASSGYRLERFILSKNRYEPEYTCYFFENGELISKKD